MWVIISGILIFGPSDRTFFLNSLKIHRSTSFRLFGNMDPRILQLSMGSQIKLKNKAGFAYATLNIPNQNAISCGLLRSWKWNKYVINNDRRSQFHNIISTANSALWFYIIKKQAILFLHKQLLMTFLRTKTTTMACEISDPKNNQCVTSKSSPPIHISSWSSNVWDRLIWLNSF